MSVALGLLTQKGISIPSEILLILSEITILIPSLIYILIKRLSFRDDLGFRRIRTGTVFMCVFLSALVTPIAWFANIVSQLFVSNTMVEMSDSLLQASDAALMILGALYGPFCEELLFRSILCNRYEKYTGPMRAGLISALLFGLAHMNINQAVYVFVLGFIFAVINKAAGSVYPSIIVHACINGSNILLMIIMAKVSDAMGNGGSELIESAESVRQSDLIYVMIGSTMILAVICAICSIPCIVWISKHEGRFEGLYDMFANKHPRVRWLTVPTALAIGFILFMMFGLEPLLSLM